MSFKWWGWRRERRCKINKSRVLRRTSCNWAVFKLQVASSMTLQICLSVYSANEKLLLEHSFQKTTSRRRQGNARCTYTVCVIFGRLKNNNSNGYMLRSLYFLLYTRMYTMSNSSLSKYIYFTIIMVINIG